MSSQIEQLLASGFTEGVTNGEFNIQLSGDVWLCVWFDAGSMSQMWIENIETKNDFYFDIKPNTSVKNAIHLKSIFSPKRRASLDVVSIETVED